MKLEHKAGEEVTIIDPKEAENLYNEDTSSDFWKVFGGKTVVVERCCDDYYICIDPSSENRFQVFPIDIAS